MANRKKLAAGRNYASRKKGKRTKKQEGNVLRTEVQRYKDREKDMQLEGGPSVSKRRLSIHQGIYNHGCTSGKVQRDFGLSKEAKARAEANLTRILELASNASEDCQHSKVTVASPSSKNSSSEVAEPAQDVNRKTAKNTADKSEESKSCPSPTEELLQEDAKTTFCERLIIAARHGIGEKSKQLAGHGRILKSLLKKIRSQVKNSDQVGFSRHSPFGVTEKLCRLQQKQLMSSRTLADNPKGEREKEPNPLLSKKCMVVTPELKSSVEGEPSVMKTILSKEYLTPNTDIEVLSDNVQLQSVHSSLAESTSPCTNIISPRALLIRYEENLTRTNNNSYSHHSSSEYESNNDFSFKKLRKQKKGSDISEKNYVIKSANSNIVGRKSYRIDDENTHIFTSLCESQTVCKHEMEKSVVVNPLDYIERYEQQTGTQPREFSDVQGVVSDFRANLPLSSDGTCAVLGNDPRPLLDACQNRKSFMDNQGSDVGENNVNAVEVWQEHVNSENKLRNSPRNMYAVRPGCKTVDLTSGQTPCRCTKMSTHSVSALVKTVSPSAVCDLDVLNNGCNSLHQPATSLLPSCDSAYFLSGPRHLHYSEIPSSLPYRTESHSLHSNELSVGPRDKQICSENDFIFPTSHNNSNTQMCISEQHQSNNYLGHNVCSINHQSHSNRPFEDANLISECKRYQAQSSDLNCLEELSKDFIYPTVRPEYSSFYLRNTKSAGRSTEPWEEPFQALRNITRSHAGESSGYISALNSASHSSTQEVPVDLPSSHLVSQFCCRNDGSKQTSENSFQKCESWSVPEQNQPYPQQVQVLEQPMQYDHHRFYRRKLY